MPPNQQNPYNQVPQQNSTGGYDVVPPLPNAPNVGHSGHNPYEFIVNPATQPRSSFLAGGSALKRLAIVLIGAVLFIIVSVIAVSLLTPQGSTADLSTIAERQQEIVRVATAGVQNAHGQDAKNFTANVEVVVTSDQGQLLGYLKDHGVKLKDKQLAVDQSAQTDSLLANAQSNNTYDKVVTSNLLDQLTAYQGLIQTSYKNTHNTNLQQTLRQSFSDSGLLIQQGHAIQ